MNVFGLPIGVPATNATGNVIQSAHQIVRKHIKLTKSVSREVAAAPPDPRQPSTLFGIARKHADRLNTDLAEVVRRLDNLRQKLKSEGITDWAKRECLNLAKRLGKIVGRIGSMYVDGMTEKDIERRFEALETAYAEVEKEKRKPLAERKEKQLFEKYMSWLEIAVGLSKVLLAETGYSGNGVGFS